MAAVIDRAVLMAQREVAERIVAPPGSRTYGLLSAITQMYARVEHLFTLPPEAFAPPPEVYSTVIRLTMHPRFEELAVDAEGFLRFLRQIFALKRKTLATICVPQDMRLLWWSKLSTGVLWTPQVRAEAVSFEAMACLFAASDGQNSPADTAV